MSGIYTKAAGEKRLLISLDTGGDGNNQVKSQTPATKLETHIV